MKRIILFVSLMFVVVSGYSQVILTAEKVSTSIKGHNNKWSEWTSRKCDVQIHTLDNAIIIGNRFNERLIFVRKISSASGGTDGIFIRKTRWECKDLDNGENVLIDIVFRKPADVTKLPKYSWTIYREKYQSRYEQ
jgi:hypothetical protein